MFNLYIPLNLATRIGVTTSFGTKVGGGLGTAIAGWMLAASGYVQNAATQSQSCVNMLHVMYLWIPNLATRIGVTKSPTIIGIFTAHENVPNKPSSPSTYFIKYIPIPRVAEYSTYYKE